MREIERSVFSYLTMSNNGEHFRGQLTIKINCINGSIANTSIFVSRGGRKKNLALSKKIN